MKGKRLRSTAELRVLWAPPCKGPFAKVGLHGDGVVHVAPAIIDAVLGLNDVLIDWDYRTRKADTGGFNCRKIAGTDLDSVHSHGIALDINWQSNSYGKPLRTDMPAGMIRDIETIQTNNDQQVWEWGGHWGTPDAMHFQICCGPRDLAMGLRGAPLPALPEEDNDMGKYVRTTPQGRIVHLTGEHWRHLTPSVWAARRFFGAKIDQHLSDVDLDNFIRVNQLREVR